MADRFKTGGALGSPHGLYDMMLTREKTFERTHGAASDTAPL
ncbi:MAG: hypothetical protein AAGB03_09475 [Pseudomonadota bacterium]